MQHRDHVLCRVITGSKPARKSLGLRCHKGQVLPIMAVLMLVIAGLFYFMINAGQAIVEKIRVTNAADAAAYSAAVIEARALNHDAYLQRAMIANEMAIAQIVSLSSWLNYFATASDHFPASAGLVNLFLLPDPNIAWLDAAFGGSALAAEYFGGQPAKHAADEVVAALGSVIAVHDYTVQALSLSQEAVHASLFAAVRQTQVANDVVRAMDPALRAEVVAVSHGFDNFTQVHAGDDRSRFAEMTMRSRDAFTRERNWTLSSLDIPVVRKGAALKKRGGTELIGFDEWRAVDTLELHGQLPGCGFLLLKWCSDVRQPVGWGAVEVDTGEGDVGHGYHGNAYTENPTTAAMADAQLVKPAFSMFSGIPASRDVRDLDSDAPSTGITIRVSKPQSHTLTSGNAARAKPVGSVALFDAHAAAGQLSALARAEVYFDRVQARSDGQTEIGSLYNPYWRVRLVAPTASDMAYAAARQDGLSLP